MVIATDYLDMLEAIEQGYDDDYKWVDQAFIASLRKQLEQKNDLSDNQKEALTNIYTKPSRR